MGNVLGRIVWAGGSDALGDVCAYCGGDNGAEVRTQAVEVLEVACAAGVGEAEW